MLEEKKIINKIELIRGKVYVEEKIFILKDSITIATSFNRFVLNKNSDLTNIDEKLKIIAENYFQTVIEENSSEG